VGLVGNYFINPLTYVDPAALSWGLYGLNVVSTRANLLGASDLLEGAAIDKYSFVRNTYLQRRRYLLSDGHASSDGSLPDYGDTPPPNYEDADQGAAAAAPASGAARAATPTAASMAPAVPEGASATVAAPATLEGPAGAAAEPASAASQTTVPGGDVVPPARIGFPSLLRLR